MEFGFLSRLSHISTNGYSVEPAAVSVKDLDSWATFHSDHLPVQMTMVYENTLHRYVDHILLNGQVVRTEKDGYGNVTWSHAPNPTRNSTSTLLRAMYYGPVSGTYARPFEGGQLHEAWCV